MNDGEKFALKAKTRLERIKNIKTQLACQPLSGCSLPAKMQPSFHSLILLFTVQGNAADLFSCCLGSQNKSKASRSRLTRGEAQTEALAQSHKSTSLDHPQSSSVSSASSPCLSAIPSVCLPTIAPHQLAFCSSHLNMSSLKCVLCMPVCLMCMLLYLLDILVYLSREKFSLSPSISLSVSLHLSHRFNRNLSAVLKKLSSAAFIRIAPVNDLWRSPLMSLQQCKQSGGSVGEKTIRRSNKLAIKRV